MVLESPRYRLTPLLLLVLTACAAPASGGADGGTFDAEETGPLNGTLTVRLTVPGSPDAGGPPQPRFVLVGDGTRFLAQVGATGSVTFTDPSLTAPSA